MNRTQKQRNNKKEKEKNGWKHPEAQKTSCQDEDLALPTPSPLCIRLSYGFRHVSHPTHSHSSSYLSHTTLSLSLSLSLSRAVNRVLYASVHMYSTHPNSLCRSSSTKRHVHFSDPVMFETPDFRNMLSSVDAKFLFQILDQATIGKVLLTTKHPHRFSNLLKVMEGMHETCPISKDMSMRGLRKSHSEPAIIMCASMIHYHELVSDNFSPPSIAGLQLSSMEDKLNGCVNEINNIKRVNTWIVIKHKLEEKGVKSFTIKQLEETTDESLEKQTRYSSDSIKDTHMDCKCGGDALVSIDDHFKDFMRILDYMLDAKEIEQNTYLDACILCEKSSIFVSDFISMEDCSRKAYLEKHLKELMNEDRELIKEDGSRTTQEAEDSTSIEDTEDSTSTEETEDLN